MSDPHFTVSPGGQQMHATTIDLDEELLAEAQRLTGIEERTALIHAGLKALIQRESARRLSLLGGSDPQPKRVRRRLPRQ